MTTSLAATGRWAVQTPKVQTRSCGPRSNRMNVVGRKADPGWTRPSPNANPGGGVLKSRFGVDRAITWAHGMGAQPNTDTRVRGRCRFFKKYTKYLSKYRRLPASSTLGGICQHRVSTPKNVQLFPCFVYKFWGRHLGTPTTVSPLYLFWFEITRDSAVAVNVSGSKAPPPGFRGATRGFLGRRTCWYT